MTQYENCLKALERLLSAVGERYWANWIREDIIEWNSTRSVRHHLSAYGGMGSFNDVWICRQNQHAVTPSQEPWAQALFEWLKSVCYYLARHPDSHASKAKLRKEVGRYDSPLAAFVGGDTAPDSMRGLVNDGNVIQGWRCLRCGHSEVSSLGIESFIAEDLIPDMVFRACEEQALCELVDRVLALDISGLTHLRKRIQAGLSASGISLHDRDGWMCPCPSCSSNDTAVYRWKLLSGAPAKFFPAKNNLPLKR